MPNWCDNVVNVQTTNVQKLSDLVEAASEGRLLSFLVPPPNNYDDPSNDSNSALPFWYMWNAKNWGTKWDVDHCEVHEQSPTEVILNFYSAWGPPVKAFIKGASTHDFSFRMHWFDPVMEMLGTAEIEPDYYSIQDESMDFPTAELNKIFGITEFLEEEEHAWKNHLERRRKKRYEVARHNKR